MAISKTFSTYGYSAFINYLSNITSAFITTDIDSNIVIGGKMTIKYVGYSTQIWVNETAMTGTNLNYNSCSGHIVYDDNFFYLTWKDGGGRRVMLMVTSTESDKYYSYLSSSGNSGMNWQPITNFTFSKVSDDSTGYTFSPMLVYHVPLGFIDYTNQSLFLNSERINEYDVTLMACNTVNSNVIYTFMSQNYFAIGTNCLVPITTE